MAASEQGESSGSTGSFSGGNLTTTRQKYTPYYLAKQLPLFQERVPRVTQVIEESGG